MARRAHLAPPVVIDVTPTAPDSGSAPPHRCPISRWRNGITDEFDHLFPGVRPIAALVSGERGIDDAAILQRTAAINSLGGYLRELACKAEAGQFSVGPMLMALVAARDRERPRV